MARNIIKSEINMVPRPIPISFRLNSVHLERASSETFDRKLK
jgi:hypothetical protein